GLGLVAWWFGAREPALKKLQDTLECVPTSAELHHRAGLLALRCSSLDDSLTHLERAVALGRANGSPRLGVYLQQLAGVLANAGRHDEADELFEEAAPHVELGTRSEVALLTNWGASRALRGLLSSVELGERALSLCRELRDDLILPMVLHNLARGTLAAGDVERSRALLTESVEVARANRSTWLAMVLCLLGATWEAERPDRAESLWREGLEEARRVNEASVAAELWARLALLHLERGDAHGACRDLAMVGDIADAPAHVQALVQRAREAVSATESLPGSRSLQRRAAARR
ncbi:MAG: tetratricopeptide repeat protein, partial [Myxococcota bacterium]